MTPSAAATIGRAALVGDVDAAVEVGSTSRARGSA